ncbi:hypothetical protein PF005_g11960 [Phytophthora fragariae]|uniref:Uncharacterized protein n=1 Tax=Phytophthora fragariae TaxID=53985 RepID=A0A6A4DNE7_9STRA|nr:hypothetical protein PF009_g17976 [Phytophthora fragariae]KAE9096703.1 hypothetical protein PF007_g16901 [Phytophthora fragariae]KAE9104267.1 hypothetical protein PF010_g13448 [Phytophthora fragariae]KAE9141886.1 hypothetical protein PF006_g12967 [Phytophthora fragariae]KAE9209086.1 hypothetical protein PF005_g11960 [Phytophthora fragariae]
MRHILQQFGRASGLQLNESKTIVIALHPSGPRPGMQLPPPLVYQEHGRHGRYLGLQVGSGVAAERSWEVADAQLNVRLELACQKTTTVDQRNQIAAAVIIPKLTYIAQHAWPSTKTLNIVAKKLRNYVWHATFAEEVGGAKAWIDADLAALDRTSGGLAVPDVREEEFAMAATTVSKWATYGTRSLHIAGDILFAGRTNRLAARTVITPNALPYPKGGVRRRATLWTTGRSLLTCAGGAAMHAQHHLIVAAMRLLADASEGLRISWEDDHYCVDGTRMIRSLFRLMVTTSGKTEGAQCLEWLPVAGLGDLHLFLEDGEFTPANRAVFGAPKRGKIVDVVSWRLIRQGIRHFFLSRAKWRGDGKPRYWLGRLILTIVTNFPLLLMRPYDSGEVCMKATPLDHPLTGTVDADRALAITTSTKQTDIITRVHSQGELEAELRKAASPDVQMQHVHPHPQVARMVQLRMAGRQKAYPRRHYKRYLTQTSRRKAEDQLRRRAGMWQDGSRQAADGLGMLEWKRIRRILGLGPWGGQPLYRLKTRALSIYDVRNGKLGCLHAQCTHDLEVDAYHLFWSCPAARKLRTVNLSSIQRQVRFFQLHTLLPNRPLI